MTTIFAVSSGRPPAAIGIIRVSGPEALAAAEQLAGRLPAPRQAGLRLLRSTAGVALDRALVLVFPGPDSATGEDLVELHCHGGRAVINAAEAALEALPGLRRAEPGEFTRTALLNGRIDLAQAEGLADLLEAETEAQRIAALAASEGRVSRAVQGWLDEVALLSARVEAMLDFADEDDVVTAAEDIDQILHAMGMLRTKLAGVLDIPPVERLRDGVRVVIAGPPNAGKSTLINMLADRDAAIISPIAGTTRDRIDVPVIRDGIPYVLSDTAGLALDTDDTIERIGIDRARAAMSSADILLWLDDHPAPTISTPVIWVQAKADLPGRNVLLPGRDALVAQTPDTLREALWDRIAALAKDLLPRTDDMALHRRERELCADAALALSPQSRDALIVAEQLRVATGAFAAILGRDSTDAMLDALFGRFCVGK